MNFYASGRTLFLELDLFCLSYCGKFSKSLYIIFLKGLHLIFNKVGSFFMINLCLVVIATQFSETKKRETAKMKAERAKFTSSSTLSSFSNRWLSQSTWHINLRQNSDSENTNLYREIIKVVRHFIRRHYNQLRRLYRVNILIFVILIRIELFQRNFDPGDWNRRSNGF